MLSCLFIAALWSPAVKGWPLGSCLWCIIVFLSLSHVVYWVRCGTWLYRFLIFAAFIPFLRVSVLQVWKRYYINTLKQEFSTAKTYEHNRLDETSIVDRHRCHMAVKFGCLLMRTIASFQRYTGYLNFINGPISRVLLLILVHVQLQSCLFFWLLASLRLKTCHLNIAQQFMKGMVKFYFGLSNIQVKFLIN